MKKTIFIVFIVCMLGVTSAYSGSAVGSSFGTMTTASTQSMGKGSFGLIAGIADFTSIGGTFTYGLSTFTDGSLKLALVDTDPGSSSLQATDDLHLTFGVDFKYHFTSINKEKKNPINMAFGGFFEYLDLGGATIIQVGGKLIVSNPIALTSGNHIIPYGSFNTRLESISLDILDDSDSNIEFGFNFGVAWEVTRTIRLLGELQLDGNDGIFLGASFNTL